MSERYEEGLFRGLTKRSDRREDSITARVDRVVGRVMIRPLLYVRLATSALRVAWWGTLHRVACLLDRGGDER